MTRAVETLEPAGGGVLFDDRVFTGLFALVGVLMVAGIVLSTFLLVRDLRILRQVATGPAVVQSRGVPLALRLQELDDLHRRGVISDAEHAQARSRAVTAP